MSAVSAGKRDISTGIRRSQDANSFKGDDSNGSPPIFSLPGVLVPTPLAGTIPSAEETKLQLAAQRIFELTNNERINAGVSPLIYSKELENCAYIRSREIVSCWSHTRPNGQPWYTVTPEIMFGENLAKGYSTPEETVMAWMNSPGHKANILNPNFTYIGVYVYKYSEYYYIAQEFCY